MTKTAKKEDQKEETKAVALDERTRSVVATDFNLDDLAADAGAGGQNVTAADLATPIISILQSNSPQCKRSDGKYIAGAIEGMLYNNVTNEVYSGEDGIVVIPCFFEKVYIEWQPNRGGLVAIHDADTPLRNQVTMIEDAEGKKVPTLPSGNQLVETNQHYVLRVNEDGSYEPAVIAMASSALKASRTWNTLTKRVTLQGPKGPFNPATYYMRYKLTTTGRQKDKFSWFGWAIEAAGPVTKFQYDAGKALEQAVKGGAVKVKQEQVDAGVPNTATDDEIPY